ncbi:DUF3224 domain-containing protein [Kitasatospora sp. NPDC008115]|uniref:DUF3224 domain-containing protein n=1 Tax=Kitasatospora sp. NPDC008115 TaxID=3364022 RepID=UPI0036E01CC7
MSTTTTVTVTGGFGYADWTETAIGPAETLPRLARASVVNAFTGGIEAAATVCEYVFVYATEKTGTFTGLQQITGRLDGRSGGFTVEERGTFAEDGTVRCAFEVVPGTATGELTGLRGAGDYLYHPGESPVPYTFSYELD